ncbi:MAG: sugar phosphate isomerase/epimerase family protein [Planctomycetota bacterium]
MADLIAVRVDPDRSVELAQMHGFAGVDLRLSSQIEWIEKFGVDRLAGMIRDAGLRPGYGSMLTRTLSARAEDWDVSMGQLPRVCRAAQALGFQRAGVVVMPFDDRLDHAANRRRHLDRLAEAAPILAEHGIRLGLEYVSPLTRRLDGTFTFIYSLADTLELIDESGQDNVGLMLDSFHWHCAQESTEDLASLPAKKIVVVHVNDAPEGVGRNKLDVRRRELPGDTGVIDLPGFVRALASTGYDGPVTAEPTHPRWPEMPESLAMRQTSEAVRGCLEFAASM